ncbi:hypothetical protein PsorP6_005931 [Peronosclerospora sorghi]|uniref:Uncharacterized protein n=1 Tax=Peronosclerospora sorghi TaxID=230839 RepID=A0ACC0W3E2_9STRA|nr:hypothetical protein PsorP6_005931 [Peronosclerospora sorghi]
MLVPLLIANVPSMNLWEYWMTCTSGTPSRSDTTAAKPLMDFIAEGADKNLNKWRFRLRVVLSLCAAYLCGDRQSAAMQQALRVVWNKLRHGLGTSEESENVEGAVAGKRPKSRWQFESIEDTNHSPCTEDLKQNEKKDEVDKKDAQLLEPVVYQSVCQGLLYVKGVLDQSTEFVDVDPRFTTIGDLKQALCDRKNSTNDLGFSAKDVCVMFGGQVVEDAWLVVNCGVGFEGAIYIVQATAEQHLVDQLDNDQLMNPLVSFNHSLSVSSEPWTSGDLFSRHVRLGEASFTEMTAGFYEKLEKVQDIDLYCEELLCGYINVLQTRLKKLEELLSNSNRACRVSTTTQKRLKSDMKELHDERNTWRLLFELRKACLGNKELAEGGDRLMNFSAGMK